jgi:hypothetical protein
MAVIKSQEAALRAMKSKGRNNKYGSKKTRINGIVFDSRAEAARWVELMLDDRVRALCRQAVFKFQCGIVYVADFVYILGTTKEDGPYIRIVEDVKGIETAEFRLKKRLFKYEFIEKLMVVKMPTAKVNLLLAIGRAKWGE